MRYEVASGSFCSRLYVVVAGLAATAARGLELRNDARGVLRDDVAAHVFGPSARVTAPRESRTLNSATLGCFAKVVFGSRDVEVAQVRHLYGRVAVVQHPRSQIEGK